jgi:hypothetical protein
MRDLVSISSFKAFSNIAQAASLAQLSADGTHSRLENNAEEEEEEEGEEGDGL